MALIDCNFFSDSLGMSSSMKVIIPQKVKSQIGMDSSGGRKEYPVLYLLHGMSDDDSIWLRRTSIERYVSSYPLIVVMPNGHKSFYANMKNGYPYADFITKELPEIVKDFFPVSDKREDTFIAGLSMGGYGAFKSALSNTDKYAAAASLSGVMDLLEDSKQLMGNSVDLAFGGRDKIKEAGGDLFALLKNAKDKGVVPSLYQICGKQDFLYEGNISFKNYAEDLGVELKYEEEDGTHEWGFWDKHIQSVLKWLPIKE